MNQLNFFASDIQELMPYNAFMGVELNSSRKSGIAFSFIISRIEIIPFSSKNKRGL